MDTGQISFTLESAEGALPLINLAERPDAIRLVSLCRTEWVEQVPDPAARVREVMHLVELLSRRSAQAMPFAALGRALLAHLKGDTAQKVALLAEFQEKLAQLGL
jgi:hypothetical protein